MIKNSKLIPEKEAQKNEDICSCTCVNQTDKLSTDKSLLDKNTDKRSSCC